MLGREWWKMLDRSNVVDKAGQDAVYHFEWVNVDKAGQGTIDKAMQISVDNAGQCSWQC